MHYIYGKVVWINKKSIILESNGVGYKINIVDGEKITLDKFVKLYIHKLSKLDHKNNVISEYYGFLNSIEKMLFIDLISINGIGAITAFNILDNDVNKLLQVISSGDIESLKLFKNINAKNSILIINTLKEKYEKFLINSNIKTNTKKNKLNAELMFALKKLGYKSDDLKYVNEIQYDEDEDISDVISKSIKFIAAKHEQQNAN